MELAGILELINKNEGLFLLCLGTGFGIVLWKMWNKLGEIHACIDRRFDRVELRQAENGTTLRNHVEEANRRFSAIEGRLSNGK